MLSDVGKLRINISSIKTLQILSLSPAIRKSELFNYLNSHKYAALIHRFVSKPGYFSYDCD